VCVCVCVCVCSTPFQWSKHYNVSIQKIMTTYIETSNIVILELQKYAKYAKY